MAEKTARKQRGKGKPFAKGASGNPKGRPPGTRNQSTLAAEIMLDGEAEAITRIAIDRAKEGDGTALRLCLERIIPPRRERAVIFTVPHLGNVADAPLAVAAITAAASAGEITISEATELARLVDSYVRAVEATDLDQRLRAVEKATAR